ncbi:hypothetical protein D3C84_1250350 [compost metagenome]
MKVHTLFCAGITYKHPACRRKRQKCLPRQLLIVLKVFLIRYRIKDLMALHQSTKLPTKHLYGPIRIFG